MGARNYEIFSGSANNDPLWLETVGGIVAATTRIKERARNLPGRYFIYRFEDSTVLVSIDTRMPRPTGARMSHRRVA